MSQAAKLLTAPPELLQALERHPDDFALRSAIADWALEEGYEVLAEALRWSCEKKRVTGGGGWRVERKGDGIGYLVFKPGWELTSCTQEGQTRSYEALAIRWERSTEDERNGGSGNRRTNSPHPRAS